VRSRHPLAPLFAAVAPFYRLYFKTLRLRIRQPDGTVVPPRRYPFATQIFAMCERDAFAIAGFVIGRDMTTLVSPGRDGDFATALVERLGARAVRGSSRHSGARALSELLKEIASREKPTILIVDGPLGPSGQAKPGILVCAQHTGREVVPVGVAARPAVVFRKAWSRLFVPWPFARVLTVCGPPLRVPPEATREEIDVLTDELTARLTEARRAALEEV